MGAAGLGRTTSLDPVDEAPLFPVLYIAALLHVQQRSPHQALIQAYAHQLINHLSLADVAVDGDPAFDLHLHAMKLCFLILSEHLRRQVVHVRWALNKLGMKAGCAGLRELQLACCSSCSTLTGSWS